MTTIDKLASALRMLKNPQNFRADPTLATLRHRDLALARASAALAEYDGMRAMDASWRLWHVTAVYRGSLYRSMSVRAVDAAAAVEKARDYFKHERLPALAKWTATELPG